MRKTTQNSHPNHQLDVHFLALKKEKTKAKEKTKTQC